jgi:hypothetical protein
MDLQKNYWVIEEINLEDPIIQPLIIFENHEEEKKFNHHDFGMLIKAALYYRRDDVFIEHGNYGVYTDLVWPYLYFVDIKKKYNVMNYFMFEHISQQPVQFWMNPSFVPGNVIRAGTRSPIRSCTTCSNGNVIKLGPIS